MRCCKAGCGKELGSSPIIHTESRNHVGPGGSWHLCEEHWKEYSELVEAWMRGQDETKLAQARRIIAEVESETRMLRDQLRNQEEETLEAEERRLAAESELKALKARLGEAVR